MPFYLHAIPERTNYYAPRPPLLFSVVVVVVVFGTGVSFWNVFFSI